MTRNDNLEFHGRAVEEYQNAIEYKLPTRFRFKNFYNVGLLSEYLKETGVSGSSDKIVSDTLKEYAEETDYIKTNTIGIKFYYIEFQVYCSLRILCYSLLCKTNSCISTILVVA